MLSPNSTWEPDDRRVTAYKVPVATSITGVPVMPLVGVMSPQGSEPLGIGVPRWVCQTVAPVVALIAYTESSSVATNTEFPHTRGSAYT